MRVITFAQMDIETLRWERVESYEYDGPWQMCKGDNSKAEQAAADAQRAQQNQLMQQQLQMQMQQLQGVNSVLDPIIQAGGMSPGQESALTSLAINQLPQDFRQTQGAINQSLVARGISGGAGGAGSGDIARNFGQLGAMEDYMKGTALSNIQVQKQQQLMQALGAKMGVAGMFGQNTGLFNQGMLGSLNSGVTAANNADQAATSWMGPVFGALGSLGGAAIGKLPGGGK